MKAITRPLVDAPWQKRFQTYSKRFHLLYATPEALPHTYRFWLANGTVAGAVLLFCAFFIGYLLARHAAYITNAEDLGIMDQALWNVLQGNSLRQTICNPISDTNCAGLEGIMRFAIHFEPVLFPVALLYLVWPDPRTLLIVQTLVVALGAFPAFWLARLRLRSELAGVAAAMLYLLYPSLHQAITFDFHAVTFTSSLLLFTFYFLYTRRTIPLIICAILVMGCKEQMPLPIIMIGLWMLVFQQRWRLGLAFMLGGALWFWLAIYVIMPHASPTGQPLLMSRFEHVGSGPLGLVTTLLSDPMAFIENYLLDPGRRTYLRILFVPVLFLPLLAPWILIIAAPSLAINMLSANPQMHSGLFQYNADIVPVLVFATIEGVVVLRWLFVLLTRSGIFQFSIFQPGQNNTLSKGLPPLALCTSSVYPDKKIKPVRTGELSSKDTRVSYTQRILHLAYTVLPLLLLTLALLSTLRYDYRFHGHMPFAQGFFWPKTTPHTRLGHSLSATIPAQASLSAQSRLVPHLSHREKIYLFPYGSEQAEYILLDVTNDVYPYLTVKSYMQAVKQLLLSGTHGIVEAHDGYLLLQRGLPPPVQGFCPTLTPERINMLGSPLASLLDSVCTPLAGP